MAVRPTRRNRCVGSALLDFLVEDLKKTGSRLLQVKTLAVEADYPPYEMTRRFCEKNGFLRLDTVNPYPPGGAGSPCAIYVRSLADFGRFLPGSDQTKWLRFSSYRFSGLLHYVRMR